MFSDRRESTERRQQKLPTPAGQCRRGSSRRERGFQNQGWWLTVSYAEELVSEKASQLLISEKIKVKNRQK